MVSIFKSYQLAVICLFLVIGMSSCLTYKQIVNFQDGEDLDLGKVDSIVNMNPLRVQTDDILLVNVSSYELEVANRFNLIDIRTVAQFSGASGSGSNVSEPLGYRVDSKGYIDMPVIGQVHVSGKTIEEIRDLVYQKVGETGYLKNHSVLVRFQSFRVTILGEVNKPGVYTVPNTKLTVLEAVGLANDLTVFSNRDNMLVIREENGNRSYGRVDLKTKSVFESDYYYLRPNDIVYVEPHKSRILATPDPITRYVGTFIAFATLLTLIITLF
jgi:polysaccharide export outer membrane protein